MLYRTLLAPLGVGGVGPFDVRSCPRNILFKPGDNSTRSNVKAQGRLTLFPGQRRDGNTGDGRRPAEARIPKLRQPGAESLPGGRERVHFEQRHSGLHRRYRAGTRWMTFSCRCFCQSRSVLEVTNSQTYTHTYALPPEGCLYYFITNGCVSIASSAKRSPKKVGSPG